MDAPAAPLVASFKAIQLVPQCEPLIIGPNKIFIEARLLTSRSSKGLVCATTYTFAQIGKIILSFSGQIAHEALFQAVVNLQFHQHQTQLHLQDHHRFEKNASMA